MHLNPFVCSGIVCHIVNAVDDAAEDILPAFQNTIHAVTILPCLDFFCVSLADGADTVCIHQPHFHIADIAVKFHVAVFITVVGHTQKFHGALVKIPLILQVMNGKQCFDTRIVDHLPIDFLQIHADRTSLPVIAVDHIGIEVQHCHHIHNRFAKECKTFVVIAIAI